MTEPSPLLLIVSARHAGTRLDTYLAEKLAAHSRSRIQDWIEAGHIRTDSGRARPHTRVRTGMRLHVSPPPPPSLQPEPEPIPLHILHEDQDLLALNKPPGLVVHPAAGHAAGTLVNALMHHCRHLPESDDPCRPGIVHRLDQYTSGVMVAAKSERALRSLRAQFKNRSVGKIYLALARGSPEPPAGRIDTLIGRHARHRKKMAAHALDDPAPAPLAGAGRRAISHYERLESFGCACLLQVRIETGRTHQIRVHLATIGHPLLGDSVYGGKQSALGSIPAIPAPSRPMLHAHRLALRHPADGRPLEFTAPMPADMTRLLAALRR